MQSMVAGAWEICLSMRDIRVRGRVEIARFGRIFKNRIRNMDCKAKKAFCWTKRPLSAILKSRTINEVIRPEH